MKLRAAALLLLMASPARPQARPHRLPPPLPQGAREAPPPPPEEIPRRSFELTLRASAGALRCDGQAPSSASEPDPCARLDGLRGLGGVALWRLWPRWALGLGAEQSRFSWGARGALAEGDGEARWTSLSLAARWYASAGGPVEPFLAYEAGPGWLAMRGDQAAIEREGLTMSGQIGLDAWISSRARLGLLGAVRWQATGAAELCSRGACLGAAFPRLPDRSFSLAASATFAWGDEL